MRMKKKYYKAQIRRCRRSCWAYAIDGSMCVFDGKPLTWRCRI